MEKPRYKLVFDEVVKAKLEKILAEGSYREIIKQWFDRLETIGPNAGKLLDNHTWLYEMKSKHPPLRLYFYHQKSGNKIVLFEIELKTSEKKQQNIINKWKQELFKYLGLFWYILSLLGCLGIPEDVCTT